MASYYRNVPVGMPTITNSLASFVYGVSSIIDELKLGGIEEIDHVDKMVAADIVDFPAFETYSPKFSIFKWASAEVGMADVFIKIQYGCWNDIVYGGSAAPVSNIGKTIFTKTSVSFDIAFTNTTSIICPHTTKTSGAFVGTNLTGQSPPGNNILYKSSGTLIFGSNNVGRCIRLNRDTSHLPTCAFIISRDVSGNVGVIYSTSKSGEGASTGDPQKIHAVYTETKTGNASLGWNQPALHSSMLSVKESTISTDKYYIPYENTYKFSLSKYTGMNPDGSPLNFNAYYYNYNGMNQSGEVEYEGKTLVVLGLFGGFGARNLPETNSYSCFPCVGVAFVRE